MSVQSISFGFNFCERALKISRLQRIESIKGGVFHVFNGQHPKQGCAIVPVRQIRLRKKVSSMLPDF
jgi:hypothetical protein